ncbi:MAG: ABC transporter ATP-binding protein [Planctomycetota bacterium]
MSDAPLREPPLLEVDDVHVSFQGRHILRGVNFTLDRGQTLVVLGGSGCGKSTLLKVIVGAVEPDRGCVRIQGRTFASLSAGELDQQRLKVGIMFQSGALFESMTVGENIACVLREHFPLTEEEVQILVTMKLEMVGLRHAEHLFPSQISGGMRKRVAMARALALNPKIMMYDEPGAGLDPITLAGVDRLIDGLGRALQMASVVVTHEIASAMRIAHQMIFLHEGSVRAKGGPAEMRASGDPYLRQFLDGSVTGPYQPEGVDQDYAEALLGSEARR